MTQGGLTLGTLGRAVDLLPRRRRRRVGGRLEVTANTVGQSTVAGVSDGSSQNARAPATAASADSSGYVRAAVPSGRSVCPSTA